MPGSRRHPARSRRRAAGLAVAALLASIAGPVGAQVITFDPADFPAGPTSPVADGYGATAGVATTYRTLGAFGDAAAVGSGIRWWEDGHGALTGVAYGYNQAGSVGEVGLRVLLPGEPVTLLGFDIGSWATRDRTLFLQVLGWDYTPLFVVEAPIGAAHFSFADFLADGGIAAPVRDDGFRIQWTQDATPATPEITGRGAYDAGIDNIAFLGPGAVTPVPEPVGIALLATGLGVLAIVGVRRRRSR